MAINQGDIAFIGINTNGTDWVAFVALNNITSGDVIYLTDNELTSATATTFNTGESYTKWTAPAGGITAGTVVIINNFDTTPVATTGTANAVTNALSANRGLSTTADVVYAYTTTSDSTVDTPITHLAYINIGNAVDGVAPASLPANLQISFTDGRDSAVYTGSHSGQTSLAGYLNLISNTANWSNPGNTATLSSALDSTPFTVAPSPAVNLSVSSNTGTEAGQTVITVTATSASAVSGDQTVNLAVSGTGITTGDYTLSNSTITIPNGQTTGSVTFTIADDTVVEGTEVAKLTISNPSTGITLGGTTTQNIIITDNDVNASLVSTVTIAGNATDLFPVNGGSGSANTNRLGGFGSDLFYDYRQNVYYALVDRGPGGGVIDYQTRVEKFAVTTDPNTGAITNYQLLETIPFTIAAGTTLNGVTYATTTPFNGLNAKIPNGNGSVLGLSQDPEGFVVGKNGNFFVSDEYGPSIYEFTPTGVFVRAFTPPNNVIPKTSSGTPYYAGDDNPATTTGRQSNRGYEGLAISPDGTKLYAMFQDPLQEEGSVNGRSSRNIRIVRYDVQTGLSDAQYIYQLEPISDINDRIPGTANDFSATAQGRNIGISSLVAINNNELLVLERDNRGIGVDPTSNLPIGSKRVYKIDLTGATDVSGISLAETNTIPSGVTPVNKTFFLDIADAIQNAQTAMPEKFEGLAIGPRLSDGTFSLILATDNDFSVTQNGSGTQFDVYYNGVSTTQVAIGSAAPTAPTGQPPYSLLPSYFYSFKTQANTLNPTPVFDFSSANYNVTEGNTTGNTATVRITRTGSVSGTDTVKLVLNDGTAKGVAAAPTQDTTKGVSSSATTYMIPTTSGSGVSLKSILTVGDSVNSKLDGTPYKMVGIPDGLGAFDNGDGTFTLLMNQEIGSTSGITRDHGGKGAFVSSWIINKSDLSVVSGSDLIKNVYNWDAVNQKSNTTTSIINFNRFCSADLPAVTAYYNPTTGLGTQERIFMNGEEGGSTGFALATVATGANKGNAYILGKFNLSTNGSGLTGVGGWENLLANPFVQDKTIVIGNNDGGTGLLSQSIAVYVGTKQSTGTEIDKAGLTNGTTKFVNVTGNTAEIVNTTTRATNITSGATFTLSGTSSTTFSRPEDGAWNPLNPSQYFFVTTDRLDQVADGVGTQIGRSRLWRLNFTDITNPDLGGTIDLLLDGTEGGNMFDNMTFDKYGNVLLQEDVGNAAHNGKIWQYNIATDTLKLLAKHDPARFGDIGVAATAPFNVDEESSGIIDAQDILGPGWFLLDTQAHYSITGELVEGGQLQALFNPDTYNSYQADYINTPITVTFAPGETYKDVQIPIFGDTNAEPNETVNLTLVNPSTGSLVGTKQPNAVLTIQSDDPPANVTLSATNINENVSANSVVGTFSITNSTVGNTITYSFVSGTNDNAAFTINGNQLLINTSPNFEVQSNYNIVVRSTDLSGLYTDKTFTVTINDVNDPATIIGNGVVSIKEGTNVNSNGKITASGSLTVTDEDAGQNKFSTTVTSASGNLGTLTITDTGNFTYNVDNSAVLYLGAGQTKVENFTVTSIDGTASKTISITINGVTAGFTGVAAGDATSNSVVLWTRTFDTATADQSAGVTENVTLQISTDSGFSNIVKSINSVTRDATYDYTLKVNATGLQSNTKYYYRFQTAAGELSQVGTFKTTPDATLATGVKFAFSGDMDGLMRPYPLGSAVPGENLDFYVNLGDVIYENASNVAGNNGGSWLNSPSVTLSHDSLSYNGIPRAFIPGGTPFATQAQLKADYEKKYRENFLPVNNGGQNSLQSFYAGQGNYTTWDNHELGNRKYIDGGAPAGGSVGGTNGTDMSTGRGVDARAGGSGNVNNVNDAADLLSPSALAALGGFMNKSVGFQTLRDVFLNYQPIAERTLTAPSDPRSDGTKQLYSAVQWGKNALYINTDTRSYRDIRLKTANGGADDTGARADNPNRTYLGDTQLAWLKQTLLDAQNAGTPWKFVSLSDPIDQLGPIGGALSGTLTPVNSDGGKSYMGGYRAERNDLLKFIADNGIKNVVFLSADDHQNRINELYYSPTGQTGVQSSYVKVPYVFSIVDGPLGATGPDTITNHSFSNIKAIADSLATKQIAAGIDPIGLNNYAGLRNVKRDQDGTLVNKTTPEAVDFYSPDTFNYSVLEVGADGNTLTVTSKGINSTAPNSAKEYDPVNNPVRTIFSFQVDAALAPTNLALSSTNVNENVAANTVIGTFTTTDPSTTDTFTYSLVSGLGSTDNSAFTISGNQLLVSSSANFSTKATNSIRVRTTDNTGLSFEKALQVNVNPTSSLSGLVYVDANNNGIVDAGESRLAGITITLTGTANNGSAVNQTATTNSNGIYQFNNLFSGNYTITETQPTGYNDGKDTIGSLGGNATINDTFSNIVVAAGATGTGYNFGEQVIPAPTPVINTISTQTASNSGSTLTGTAGIDRLTGGSGNDILIGLGGRDILTGSAGADTFLYNSLTDSLFTNVSTNNQLDNITDFNQADGDRIAFANDFLPSSLFNAGVINAANLQAALVSVYGDRDPSVAGSQPLNANEAVFFTFGVRTYLSVNDGTAGFSNSSDLVIDVTNIKYKAGDNIIGSLNVNDYFRTSPI